MLPTFPSRYWSTIGLPIIFSLAAWSPRIQTGFHVSRPTQVPLSIQSRYPYGPFTLCGLTFQTVPVPNWIFVRGPTTPVTPYRSRFRLFPFRSPLLRESIFLSFPAGTKMFQFPASAPSNDGMWPSTTWVPPFGNLRINSCLQIPGAYRSLPRPSSLSEAKASSVRSCSLSL